jgi:tetratricopeptide (TPR) repeat protein
MKIDETYIEAFIKGQLTAEQHQSAQARYAAEPAFKQAVDEMRMLIHLARLSHATHVAEQVGAARQRHEVKPRASGRRIWYWAAAAAAIFVVVGVYWLQRRPSNQALYAEAFKPAEYRGITAGPSSRLPEAYRLYAQQYYKEATPLLAAIPIGTLEGDSAHFYLANCYMWQEQFDSAITELQALAIRNPETDYFGQDIRWYLALALLHEGLVEDAKRYLEVLVAQPHGSHRDAAQELLGKLE